MIKVKTFSSQLKIFHTRNELLELDREVNDFVVSHGIRKVISVSDAVTTGNQGEAIGVIRVLTYEDPDGGARERVLAKMERKLKDWGDEAEKLRGRTDRLGSDAREKFQEQAEELRAKQESARRKLQALRKAGGEAWEDLQAGAEAALDDLKKAMERAVKTWKK